MDEVDGYIEKLSRCEILTENEVRSLCDKVLEMQR